LLESITHLLQEIITNFYISTGLLGIVLCMAIESCCIPLPSEVVMTVAGIMLVNHHFPMLEGMNQWLALGLISLAGAVGCLLGSMLAYWIGAKGGRPLMLKYGRYVLISQHDADKADAFFQRWGSATAFFSRLLPIVRTYISLPAGIAKMPFGKFCFYTFVGSLPWCFLLAYAGFALGSEENLKALSSSLKGFEVVIAVALAVLVVLYIWRHIRHDNQARAAHKAAEATASQSGIPSTSPVPPTLAADQDRTIKR
jgi:membrane protein DedA with SNARE-associated domain